KASRGTHRRRSAGAGLPTSACAGIIAARTATKGMMAMKEMQAEPYAFNFDPKTTALVVIDMQRDFVEPGGFGEALGNDVSPLQAGLAPCKGLLDIARLTGMFVIHAREGLARDLGDCPPSKRARGRGKITIGDEG